MKKKEKMPDPVDLGLLGVNSKNAAYVYVAGSFLLAIGCIFPEFRNPNFYWRAGFLIYSLWFLYCISGVDNNSRRDA